MKLPLPAEALDDRIAIVGRSGYGKTNAAKVLAERLLAAKARVCIIDPTDAWWGLRLMPNGKDAGFPVAIFGGAHGDLSLTETAGDTIGRAIAGSSQSTIVSMADFIGENARRRFASGLLGALYAHNRAPLHLIVDEADTLAPQRTVAPLDAEVLARMQQIVRRGRIRGFTPWLITQRPAVLSKDVLSQADALIAFNLTASQDRDAIGGWIEGQADKAEQKAILAGLPKLPRGTATVWAPGRAILETAAFPLSATFDSGRSPKRGEARPTATLKPIDVDGLRASIVEVEEKAKADDPKALRAEIARLKGELAKKPASDPATDLNKLQQEAWADGHRTGQDEARIRYERRERSAIDDLGKALALLNDAKSNLLFPAMPSTPTPGVTHARQPFTPATSGTGERFLREPQPAAKPTVEGVNGPMQRILDALAELAALGIREASRIQVVFLSGYGHPNSKGFVNSLGALSTAGFVTYPRSGVVALTEAGSAAANHAGRPLTSADLQRRVLDLLGAAHGRILQPLIEAYPAEISRQDLCSAAGYGHMNSKGFVNAIGRLRSLGFIDYPARGNVVALPVLFVGR